MVIGRMLEATLPFRKIVDIGMAEYREFACSRATYEWLAGGAMTHLDGQPVTLAVVDVCRNPDNVIVAAWRADNQTSAAYAWQKQAA